MRAPDAKLFDLWLPPLHLEGGSQMKRHVVRGWWWGPEDDLPWLSSSAQPVDEVQGYSVVRRSIADVTELERSQRVRNEADRPRPSPDIPTVVVVHALTGDMRVAGEGGWWPTLAGEGAVLDPAKVRVLCFNNLGSCYGTSGPSDWEPGPDSRPGAISTWDQARSLLLALDSLGIGKIKLLVGGSIGGAVALCLAALAGDRVENLVPIATAEACSPWVIGFNHIARQAIRLDPGYPDDLGPGLSMARQLAHMTYRAEAGLLHRHGRGYFLESEPEFGHRGDSSFGTPYRVQAYLEHQGSKLVKRFNGASYLSLLDAVDHHDLARDPGSPSDQESWRGSGTLDPAPGLGDLDLGCAKNSFGLTRIHARVLAVAVNSDQLFFPEHSRTLCDRLKELGKSTRYEEISSVHGHDGFLMELDQIEPLLVQALNWND